MLNAVDASYRERATYHVTARVFLKHVDERLRSLIPVSEPFLAQFSATLA